jgi:uncharacterized protein
VALELGDPVRVAMTKWGGGSHWEFDARWLGTDEHGDWIGLPVGTAFDRPGAHFTAMSNQVGLVPSAALAEDERWWVGTFHAPGGNLGVQMYVDIASPPAWDGSTLRCVDLDLDVVRGETGRIWVDDEDEFAQHRVELDYPDDVVAAAMRSCDHVLATMTAGHPPYDGTHERWLATLADLSARS